MRPIDRLREELDADAEARRRQRQRAWAREAFPGTAGGAALTAAPVAQPSTRVPAVVASRARAGAHIHVVRATAQSLAPGATAIEWTEYNPNHPKVNFPDVTFPTTELVIEKTGYYDFQPELEFDLVEGASLAITRTREGHEATVWPFSSIPGGWDVAYSTSRFWGSVAKGIDCKPGDIITVYFTHNEASSIELSKATLTIEEVDWAPAPEDEWELMFSTDNYGVAWNEAASEWWTTLGNQDDVNPALFRRSPNGTILNSYDGYDTKSPRRNRGVVVLDGWLWGLANQESVFQIDMATGSSVGSWSAPGGNSHSGIGTDGTNLFIIEGDNGRVYEVTTTGTVIDSWPFPTGRVLRGITFDGSSWWATTTGEGIVRMTASMAEVEAISGPTLTENRGLEHQDGYLYCMTDTGLYRRLI